MASRRLPSALTRTTVVCALACAALGGCYRHVVGVKGNGPNNYEVHEANIKDGEGFWQPTKPRVVGEDGYAGPNPGAFPTGSPKALQDN
jgi:hypothetical protein